MPVSLTAIFISALCRPRSRIDSDQHMTALGELHRVAHQIGHHLPEPAGIAR